MPKGPTFKLDKTNKKKVRQRVSVLRPLRACAESPNSQLHVRAFFNPPPPLNSEVPEYVMSQPRNGVAEGALICNVTVKEWGGGRRIIQTRNCITGSLFAFSFPTASYPCFFLGVIPAEVIRFHRMP